MPHAKVSSGEAPPRRSLLSNPNFTLLIAAYGVSALGDHLSEIAILKTRDVLRPDVDVTALNARMTFMFFLPFVPLAPLAGWLADRLPRRGVMIIADLIRAVVMWFFAGLIAYCAPWGSWGPFVPLLIVGAFAAMFSPARAALLPSLVHPDQLARANGMIAGLGIVSTMAANLLGGYLAKHHHPEVAFRWDAATFAASAIFVALIRPAAHPHHAVERTASAPLREIAAGFRYARTHRRVRQLLIVAALVWFCGSLVNSVIPAVVRDVYHLEYQAMSGFRAFLGLGFILGAASIALLGDALRSEVAITWSFYGISAAVLVFASSIFLPVSAETAFVIGAIGVVGSGVFGVSVMASLEALLQRTVCDRYRGRVFGVRDVCSMATLLLAMGMLALPEWTRVDRWVGWILLSVSALTATAGVTSLFIRLRSTGRGKLLSFAVNLNEFIAKAWWRLRRVGPLTVPHQGPIIVTANHTCYADPLLLIACVRYRLISFIIADEYAHLPVLHHFTDLAECIPVKRGSGDQGSTQSALRHLRDGKALGIFIEGGIVEPGETPKLSNGVALLALRTGAKVIPAHISGVRFFPNMFRGLLSRHRACVRFGKPVDLSEFGDQGADKDAIRAATQKIYAAVRALAPAESKSETHSDTN